MDSSGEDRKWAVMLEGVDEPVGYTALYGLGRQTAPELGAIIGDERVAGKGVGREAERLTNTKAYEEFGAHKVYGRIPATNEAAKKAVIYNGWKQEGVLRKPRPPRRRADRRRALGRLSRGPARAAGRVSSATLIEDGGEAAADARPVLPLTGVPGRRGRHAHARDRRRRRPAADPADRARRSRAPSASTRSRPTATPAARRRRRSRPTPAGSTGPTPAWSASSSATGSASPSLAGGTVRSEVVHRRSPPRERDPQAAARADPGERATGLAESAIEPGPEADPVDREAFETAYAETMRRTGAAERYLFSSEYFERVLAEPSAWLLLAGRAGEPPRAGAIAVTSDGLPPLLPRRHRGRRARRLADEEPVRGDDLARRRARARRSTSAAGSAPGTRSSRSSGASRTTRRPSGPTS